MRRFRVLVAIPILAVSMLSATPVSAGHLDCATDGLVWPEKGDAEGATFLGRVVGEYRTAHSWQAYKFKVLEVYAGNIGDEVRVVLKCVDTEMAMGRRLLISSAAAHPGNGDEIHRVNFNDEIAVSWRVKRDNTVELKRYGPGYQAPIPQYLKRPDTLQQAVRAVTAS